MSPEQLYIIELLKAGSNLGVAIVLAGVLLWFAGVRLFPFFVSQIEQRDKEIQKRDETAMAMTTVLLELKNAFSALNVEIHDEHDKFESILQTLAQHDLINSNNQARIIENQKSIIEAIQKMDGVDARPRRRD